MKFKPLVIWIWNQNIAISTIVGTSSHIILLYWKPNKIKQVSIQTMLYHGNLQFSTTRETIQNTEWMLGFTQVSVPISITISGFELSMMLSTY
jgi:hypothetical protein